MSAARAVGAMRQRMVLLVPQDVADGIGGQTRSYVAGASIWAEIVPLSGTDRFIAGRMEQSVTHRILIRYRADVTGASRLALGARVFIVHAAIDPDSRRRFLDCRCEEIT